MRNSKVKDWLVAIIACLFVLLAVGIITFAKIEAYDGDASCLFVHCVKVIK